MTPPPSTADGPARTELRLDATSDLAGLIATVESAYEIGHPTVDLVVLTGDADALRAWLLADAPADLFLADDATGRGLIETGRVSTEPIPFAVDHIALLGDRSGARIAATQFLAWLLGAEGKAIVRGAGLEPMS